MPLYIILLPESTGLTETINGIVYRPPIVDSAGHLKVDVLTSGLPADAATETTLAEIAGYVDQLEALLNALASMATDQLRVDLVTPFTPTAVGSGQATVAAAGSTEALPAQACKAVSIAANPDNTGNIFLGDSTVSSANGRILAPGDTLDLAIDNLNRLYIDAAVDGEGISYLWVS